MENRFGLNPAALDIHDSDLMDHINQVGKVIYANPFVADLLDTQ